MTMTLWLVGEPKPWDQWQHRLKYVGKVVETLYYPYYVSTAKVEAKGMGEGRFAVWIDLCRGGESISEAAVERTEIEVPAEGVLPMTWSTAKAAHAAKAFAIHVAIAKGRWFRAPRVRMEPGEVLYRLFYVVDETLLVDGITGESALL